MAKFTGWNADELKSRVDVTKYLCNYIKEKNLQNPKDRRQIIADTKLAKLLDYDNKKDTQPLTYFLIQSHLKKHFIKSD
jgi:chromatin remodeling complex protein RSC6